MSWHAPLDTVMARFMRCVVFVYRVTLGQVMGGHCRFTPTCSQYMLDAIERHGPWRGTWRGLKRIARCHPFGGHGHDPA